MEEQEKKSYLRMIEKVSTNSKVKPDISIFLDGKGGNVYNSNAVEGPLTLPLNTLHIKALELRAQTIDLPIGNFKLIRDHVSTGLDSSYTRITDYERIFDTPTKK